MQANRDAPAFAEGSVAVDAPPSTVWEVLTGLADWPRWNSGVKSVAVDGPIAPGTTFRWKSGPGTIRSTLVDVDEPRAIAWSGKTLGIRALHAWQIDEVEGRTAVATQESWEGVIATVLRPMVRPTLQRAVDDGLAALKAEAERRAAPH